MATALNPFMNMRKVKRLRRKLKFYLSFPLFSCFSSPAVHIHLQMAMRSIPTSPPIYFYLYFNLPRVAMKRRPNNKISQILIQLDGSLLVFLFVSRICHSKLFIFCYPLLHHMIVFFINFENLYACSLCA